MAKLTFEELIDEYLKCIKVISDIDYGDKNSVRKCNKAVDKMIKISKCIGVEHPSRIHNFAELLARNDFRIDAWVAHHILENMDYPPELEGKALDIIIKYSKEDTPEGFGNRIWLGKWYEKKTEGK